MTENNAYIVLSQNETYRVVDANNRTIIECRDEQNANHYATLLNQAYRAGYKEGYRDGKPK